MPTSIEDRLRSYAGTLDAAAAAAAAADAAAADATAAELALCHRIRQSSPVPVTQTEEPPPPLQFVLDVRRSSPRRSLGLVAACVAIVAAAGLGIVLTGGPSARRGAAPGDAGDPASNVVDAAAANPVSWETDQVSLTADDFRIEVNGVEFVADDPAIEVTSDPGDADYQTLELTWTEHGVEMRWYVYFWSDGIEWGSTEMRTYDGNAAGEWVTFTGDFFRSQLGEAYAGDIDLTATDHGVTSHLRVSGLTLEAFRG